MYDDFGSCISLVIIPMVIAVLVATMVIGYDSRKEDKVVDTG